MVGALVGAVQSGKTGALGAIAATALDLGYRVVVVLSGLKDDLRMQTARRLNRDLLQRGDPVYRWTNGEWQALSPSAYDHPEGEGFHGELQSCWSPHYLDDANQDGAFRSQVARELEAGNAVLVTVKKNRKSLEVLHQALENARRLLGVQCVPLLVLDDECDEASIAAGSERPTPRSVQRLVAGPADQTSAYVGVTATIAANILQDTEDPLFPRDFIEVMKTASDEDTALTFYEGEPDRRYSGGTVFYEFFNRLGVENYLVAASIGDDELAQRDPNWSALSEALVAYFVSGAIRISLQPGRSPLDAALLTRPHSMLIHTAAALEDHRQVCGEVIKLISRHARREAPPPLDFMRLPPEERINPADLAEWVRVEPDRWQNWHNAFQESHNVLEMALPGRLPFEMPSWESTQASLATVFQATKLRVVNSDDSADPPLDFSRPTSSGEPSLPSDVFSIIIGGNRLSRGLTIEDLCISYFTRMSSTWAEDVTQQRERWFGYRGPHLEFCRVFVHEGARLRLAHFHQHDVDLRTQFAWSLRRGHTPLDTAYRMLCLPDSVPTTKALRGRRSRLQMSGRRMFSSRLQMGNSDLEREAAEHNLQAAVNLYSKVRERGTARLSESGHTLGFVLNEMPSSTVINYLEQQIYTFHNPDPERGNAKLLGEFHRPPVDGFPPRSTLPADSCPFLLAAYLRYWRSAFERTELGESAAFKGPDGITPWEPCPPPVFNIAFRLGTMPTETGDLFHGAPLLNRKISSDGNIEGRWGGHGATKAYFGDEWLDIDPPTGDRTQPRTSGLPGLLLVHVAHRDARGRDGTGSNYLLHRPFVGIVVPEGGPAFDFVLADPAN